MVSTWTDDDIWFKAASRWARLSQGVCRLQGRRRAQGQPTVILVKTIRGYGLGALRRRNATHQMKKLKLGTPSSSCATLKLPISDATLEADPLSSPPTTTRGGRRDHPLCPRTPAEARWRPPSGAGWRTRRSRCRMNRHTAMPAKSSGKQQVATTMAWVRLLRDLMRDRSSASGSCRSFPDEAGPSDRATIKIITRNGQTYTSVDADHARLQGGDGPDRSHQQAGSMGAFAAAATSYATHPRPISRSISSIRCSGFQRTADSIWAASDQMSRGASSWARPPAGRRFHRRGLQHADGHSHLLAATNPAVVACPRLQLRIAHIMRSGLERMFGESGW